MPIHKWGKTPKMYPLKIKFRRWGAFPNARVCLYISEGKRPRCGILIIGYIDSTTSIPNKPNADFITVQVASTIARRAFFVSMSTSSRIMGFVL